MRRFASAVALALVAALGRPVAAGPVEDARRLVAADRPRDAADLLRARLDDAPLRADLWTGLGDAERVRCRLAAAETAFRRALELDLFDPGARAGLAEVAILRGEPEAALVQARLGVEGARTREGEDARPWRLVALSLVELRRYEEAVVAARRAVALAPLDAKCSEALASAEFRAGRMEASRAAYLRAVALDPRSEEANLRLGNGFAAAATSRPWTVPGRASEGVARALAAWDADDLRTAEREWLDLLRADPASYKYRLGLGLVRTAARRRNESFLGVGAYAIYGRLTAPALPGLERVVRGYERLSELERLAVRVATAPARPVWEAILASGVTHDLFPIEADLTDARERRGLLDARTPDGRWYAHLRGVGGTHGGTGTEKLLEAAGFGFHTFAHEFGHQVHRYGLSTERQREVDRLYAAALAAGRTLDYYAASTVDEYFAQGYEAFVSPLKRGCLSETARHTRDELERRDPALLAFLRAVLDLSHEAPDAFARVRAEAERDRDDPEPARAEPANGR